MLTTGTVVGAGANVFGVTRPPRCVGPFAWGVGGEVMAREKFLEVAERVMPRRKVDVTDAVRAMLASIREYEAPT